MLDNRIGWPDEPLTKLENDCFKIEPYVKGLSMFIEKCETPMTVSIQGDWGSGKTSLMNMIKEQLENHNSSKTINIWFNTWQFSQFDLGDNLVFSMLHYLMRSLNADSETKQKLSMFFKKSIPKIAGIGVELASGIGNAGGAVAEGFSKILEAEEDNAKNILGLKEALTNCIEKKLKKENCNKIVVFIDDLDRLPPAKAVELLEAMKLFLDLKKCVFVLAVDYEVVVTGVKQKFGDSVDEEKGRSFFDKIIQLPFKMPVSQYDIDLYIRKFLESMNIRMDTNTKNTFLNLVKTSVGLNPRVLKRLFNTYQLLEAISINTTEEMDSIVRQRILFAIICMQMSYENLYRYIASDFEDLSYLLEELKSKEKIKEDEELMSYLNLNEAEEDMVVSRIAKFMTVFYEAIQLDDDKESLSEEELDTLNKVLKDTVITSIGTDPIPSIKMTGKPISFTIGDKQFQFKTWKDILVTHSKAIINGVGRDEFAAKVIGHNFFERAVRATFLRWKDRKDNGTYVRLDGDLTLFVKYSAQDIMKISDALSDMYPDYKVTLEY